MSPIAETTATASSFVYSSTLQGGTATGVEDKTSSLPLNAVVSASRSCYSLTSLLIGVPLTRFCTSKHASRWIRPYISPHSILLAACICELLAAYYLQYVLDRNAESSVALVSSLSGVLPLPSDDDDGEANFLFTCLNYGVQVAFAIFLVLISFVCFIWSPVYSRIEKLQTSIDPFCSLLFRFLHLYAVGHIIGTVMSKCIVVSIPPGSDGSESSSTLPLGALLPGLQGILIFIIHLKELQCVLQDCRLRRSRSSSGNQSDTTNVVTGSSLPIFSSQSPSLCFPPPSLPVYPPPPQWWSRWLFDSASALEALGVLVILVVLVFSAVPSSFFTETIDSNGGRSGKFSSASEETSAWPILDVSLCRHLRQHDHSSRTSSRNLPSSYGNASIIWSDNNNSWDEGVADSDRVPLRWSNPGWGSWWMLPLGVHWATFFRLFDKINASTTFPSSSSPPSLFIFSDPLPWSFFSYFSASSTAVGKDSNTVVSPILPLNLISFFFRLFWWWVLVIVHTVVMFLQTIVSLVWDKSISPPSPHQRQKILWCSSLTVLFASCVFTNVVWGVGEVLCSSLNSTDLLPSCTSTSVGLCMLIIALDIMWSSYRGGGKKKMAGGSPVRSSCGSKERRSENLERDPAACSLVSSCIRSLLPSAMTYTHVTSKRRGKREKGEEREEPGLSGHSFPEKSTMPESSVTIDSFYLLPGGKVMLPPSLPVIDTERCSPISSLLVFFLLVGNVCLNLCFCFPPSVAISGISFSVKEEVSTALRHYFTNGILLVFSRMRPSSAISVMRERYEKGWINYQTSLRRRTEKPCVSPPSFASFSSLFIFIFQHLPTVLFAVSLLSRLSFSHFHVPILSPVRNVFIDGVYDLCHVGHKRAMKAALSPMRETKSGRYREGSGAAAAGRGNQLFVGVCGDEECVDYKRLPLMTTAERVREVESCGFAAVVIPYSPVKGVGEDILEYYNIHVVLCSEEYEKPDDTYYKIPRSLGILNTLPRTPGISTSDLLERIRKREKAH